MSFEKEFPSFENDSRWCPSPIYSIIDEESALAYWREDAIKEHCLDKQRVRDVLKEREILEPYDDEIKREILKEIGLEGE